MKRTYSIGLLVLLAVLAITHNANSNVAEHVDSFVVDGFQTGVHGLKKIESKLPYPLSPIPFLSSLQSMNSNLTVSGTIADTNIRRQEHGAGTLTENALLDAAALKKVDDMFALQYFEHESPTGITSKDLVVSVAYDYLDIGENLALGNFADDVALVQAWMDSPGHRENMLNPKFTEIGVAVKRGMYKGRMTWLAVQEFGRPASLCESPNDTLRALIDTNHKKIDALERKIALKRAEMDRTANKQSREYADRVSEYNALINPYNALVNESKTLVANYNIQVQTYNQCL